MHLIVETFVLTRLDQVDFDLMCNNAILYNAPSTVYCKEAKRLLAVGEQLQKKIKELGKQQFHHNNVCSSSSTLHCGNRCP